MTITNTTLRNSYTGNGVATVFAFTFVVINEVSQAQPYTIQVLLTDTLGAESIRTQGVDYTVQLGDDGLGTVTFAIAPILNYKITLLSNVPNTQETDYIKSGTDKFPAESHEKALDKLTLICKQFTERFNRVLSLPKASSLSNITVPISTNNANQLLVVNSAGDGLETKTVIDLNLTPVSTFAATLLDDTTPAQARETLQINRRVAINNADYQIISTDQTVAQTGTMSAARTFNLPSAASFPAGEELIIIDQSGTVTPTNTITISRNGSDTIDGATSEVINSAYGFVRLISDGTSKWKKVNTISTPATETVAGIALLPKQITIANNATDANNDIDFGAGNFQFSDGSGQGVISALTKRLDASWAAGTNQGGLDTGTKGNSTWYYIFGIYNPTTLASDILFSASPTSPTLPSGFTKKSKVLGAMKTNSSGNILTGTWYNDRSFYFTTSITEFTASNGPVFGTNITLVGVPLVSCSARLLANSGALVANAYPVYSIGTSSTNILLVAGSASGGGDYTNGFVPCGSNATVYHSFTASNSSILALYTNGYQLTN